MDSFLKILSHYEIPWPSFTIYETSTQKGSSHTALLPLGHESLEPFAGFIHETQVEEGGRNHVVSFASESVH